MQPFRRSLQIATSTPPAKRPLESISDVLPMPTVVHNKRARAKLPINNMSDNDIANTQSSKHWCVSSIGTFNNQAAAERFRRQRCNDTSPAFYFTKIDAHWFNEQARGRYYPPAIHTAPSSRNIADKLAQRLRRLWFTRKLNQIGAYVEPLPIPLTELDPVHNIHRFVNHALDRVRRYFDVDEDEDQFRIDFARQAIFDPPGVWIDVPRLLEARRSAAKFVDVNF
jgi:hypothetical protein